MIDLFGIARQTEFLRKAVDWKISKVLDHGQYILGPEVQELEDRLSEYLDAYVVTVSSGRDALLIALLSDGVGIGDAVAVPAFTFPATAEVVLACGATPVFIDIDPHTWTMDPNDLREKIEVNPHISVIIPVDIFGVPADYESIHEIAGPARFVLSDGAQSFGSKAKGWVDARALSFYPTKPLGCFGDGGALVTGDADQAASYRLLRSNGLGPHGQQYDYGMSARLDTIQAAVLLAKMGMFEAELERRREIVSRYDEVLQKHDQIIPQIIPTGVQSAHALYTVRSSSRDKLQDRLSEAGIQSKVYYPIPVHRQPAYTYLGAVCPVAEQLCNEVLSIPCHPYLTEDEVEKICEVLSEPQ